MLDKKIIYKDPMEREISEIIDLTDKSKTDYKAKTGCLEGRNVQQLDKNVVNPTVEKLDRLSKKAENYT